LIIANNWFLPTYVDVGAYAITVFSNIGLTPPVNKQYYNLIGSYQNRILSLERSIDQYNIDINVVDLSGNNVDGCAGFIVCRIPFYFENV